MRFRRELLRHGLDQILFDLITAQLRRRAVQVKTGTLVDASVVGSASQADVEAGWAGHRRRKAVHGYKVHVGADAETALVEQLAVTPGNVHDGNHGESALPPDPGEVYADSAYRGRRFAAAVHARGGTPRIAAIGGWAPSDPASQLEARSRLAERNRAIHRVRARVEKIFGTRKRSYGFRRMRWRGLAKAHLQARLTATAYNLTRARPISWLPGRPSGRGSIGTPQPSPRLNGTRAPRCTRTLDRHRWPGPRCQRSSATAADMMPPP